MQGFFDFLGRFTGLLTIGLSGLGFYLLIRQMKKSNRIRPFSYLLGIVFSLAMLLINILFLQKVKLNWIFIFTLIFGAGFGYAWGTTTKMRMQKDQVIGKRSVLYIYFWLASFAITQILAIFAKTGAVSVGLASMFFSAGATMGTNTNILLRIRRLYRSANGAPTESRLTAEAENAVRYCVQCGNPLREGNFYCTRCGYKIKQPA
jgi:uncharacterized paraquat-inducible protein A